MAWPAESRAATRAPDAGFMRNPYSRETLPTQQIDPYLFLAPTVITMSIALFFPLPYMVYRSFRDWDPSQTLSKSEFIGSAITLSSGRIRRSGRACRSPCDLQSPLISLR